MKLVKGKVMKGCTNGEYVDMDCSTSERVEMKQCN